MRTAPAGGLGEVPTRIAAGIVGWADLMQPVEAARTLDGHIEAGEGRFRGVRFNVVWHDLHSTINHAGRATVPHMLLDDTYRAGLREVANRGLTYDVWLFHPQLLELADTLDAVPDLTFVVNHLGGPVPDEATPASRSAIFGAWRSGLREVGSARTSCSSLVASGCRSTASGCRTPSARTPTALTELWRPYFEAAIEIFGPERCMFESNLPIDKQSFNYDSVWNAFKRLSGAYSYDERSSLFSGTATRRLSEL